MSVARDVVTSSDARDLASAESGRVILEQREAGGHVVAGRAAVGDDPAALGEVLERLAPEAAGRAVPVRGGAGFGRGDGAFETSQALFETRLDVFGELFRAFSGAYRGMVVFARSGSPAAARLALGRLVLPELEHVVRELARRWPGSLHAERLARDCR